MAGLNQRMREVYFTNLARKKPDPEEEQRLVDLVFESAKRIVVHPSRPRYRKLTQWQAGGTGEFAIEETLDENPTLLDWEQIYLENQEERQPVFHGLLDCSSSMSGEKHLLASIAVAVMLLDSPPAGISLFTFANESRLIRQLGHTESIRETLLRFLRHRPKGFTNIRAGLEAAWKEHQRLGGRRRCVGLLASDGRSTEGGDPLEVAKYFDTLVVLHMQGPGSSIEASRELAAAGNGWCLEVKELSELPHRLYDALRAVAQRGV